VSTYSNLEHHPGVIKYERAGKPRTRRGREKAAQQAAIAEGEGEGGEDEGGEEGEDEVDATAAQLGDITLSRCATPPPRVGAARAGREPLGQRGREPRAANYVPGCCAGQWPPSFCCSLDTTIAGA
jgi:hypothetical protein